MAEDTEEILKEILHDGKTKRTSTKGPRVGIVPQVSARRGPDGTGEIEPPPVKPRVEHNGALDIFVNPGPGVPAVKLVVRGDFNGWVNLSPPEAMRIARALIKAASSIISMDDALPGVNEEVASDIANNIAKDIAKHVYDAALVKIIPGQILNPGPGGRSAQIGGPVSRLDAPPAGPVYDIPSGMDGNAKGRGRKTKGSRTKVRNA